VTDDELAEWIDLAGELVLQSRRLFGVLWEEKKRRALATTTEVAVEGTVRVTDE